MSVMTEEQILKHKGISFSAIKKAKEKRFTLSSRILADNAITVEVINSPLECPADFNTATKLLRLNEAHPKASDSIDELIFDRAKLFHELGHSLFTKDEAKRRQFYACKSKNAKAFLDLSNILEDGRIERLLCEEWKGSKFYLDAILAKEIETLAPSPEMGLALYVRTRLFRNAKEEKVWQPYLSQIDKAVACDSTGEVCEIANDIVEKLYAPEPKQPEQPEDKPENEQEKGNGEPEQGEQGEERQDESKDDSGDSEQNKGDSDEQPKSEDEQSEDEQSEDEQSEDEQSEDEQSEDEQSEDEQSEDEQSEDEQSEDEQSEDEQSEDEGESETGEGEHSSSEASAKEEGYSGNENGTGLDEAIYDKIEEIAFKARNQVKSEAESDYEAILEDARELSQSQEFASASEETTADDLSAMFTSILVEVNRVKYSQSREGLLNQRALPNALLESRRCFHVREENVGTPYVALLIDISYSQFGRRDELSESARVIYGALQKAKVETCLIVYDAEALQIPSIPVQGLTIGNTTGTAEAMKLANAWFEEKGASRALMLVITDGMPDCAGFNTQIEKQTCESLGGYVLGVRVGMYPKPIKKQNELECLERQFHASFEVLNASDLPSAIEPELQTFLMGA